MMMLNLTKACVILAGGAVFFLFYAILGNAAWIAFAASILTLAGLWFVAIDPLQRRLLQTAARQEKLSAIEQLMTEAQAKVAGLKTSASGVKAGKARSAIVRICQSLEEALRILRQDSSSIDRWPVRQLVTVNLDSTIEFVDYYKQLAVKRTLEPEESQTLEKAEQFLSKLSSRYAYAISEIEKKDVASRAAALETQMEMLNLLFSGDPDEPAADSEDRRDDDGAAAQQTHLESNARGKQ
jgi:hypothetical protein